jgi:hypothetical protein
MYLLVTIDINLLFQYVRTGIMLCKFVPVCTVVTTVTATYRCCVLWPRGLSSQSAAARLLSLWVRITLGGHRCLFVESVVLSGSLCDGLITRMEKSYRLRCVAVCDLETSSIRRPWPTGGSCALQKCPSLRTFDCCFLRVF